MAKLRKPKKPLSAYNIFFQEQREKMLSIDDFRRGGEGYANMARFIASKWGDLDTKSRSQYVKMAKEEKKKHMKALAEWKRAKKVERFSSSLSDSSSASSSPTNSQGSMTGSPQVFASQSPGKNAIPSDVLEDINQWANAFGSNQATDNDGHGPLIPELSLSSAYPSENHCNEEESFSTLEVSTDSKMEKHINDTIDDLRVSADDDFVSFMTSFFD